MGVTGSVRITWKPEYAGTPHLFSLPHRAHAAVEKFGTEGHHTYFSVIRLLVTGVSSFVCVQVQKHNLFEQMP